MFLFVFLHFIKIHKCEYLIIMPLAIDNSRHMLKHQLQNQSEATMKMKLLMVIYQIIIAKMNLKYCQSLQMVHPCCLGMMMMLKKIKQVIFIIAILINLIIPNILPSLNNKLN